MTTQTKTSRNNTTQNKELPLELRKWNWGAFFLCWIWGLGNRTYIALLSLLPIGNIIMPFVLGAKGNEWAWQNKKWESIEHFKRVQRLWSIWGVSLFFVIIALVIIGIFAGMNELSNSELIKTAVSEASQDQAVIEKIGTPIERKGYPGGNVSVSGSSGYSNSSIDIEGPKGKATVYIKAFLENDRWNYVQLVVKIHATQELIEIVNYPADSPEVQKYEHERQALSKND